MQPAAPASNSPPGIVRRWFAALSRSLSLRLLGIFALTTVCALIILVLLFTKGLGSQWRDTIQPHFVQYLSYVQRDLGDPPDPARAEALANRLPVTIVIYQGTKLLYSSEEPVPNVASLRYHRVPVDRLGRGSGAERPQGIVSISADGGGRNSSLRIEQNGFTVYYRFRRVTAMRGERDVYEGDAQSAVSATSSPRSRRGGSARRHGFHDELMWGLLALGGIMGLSYWLIRRLLSPVGAIQRSVGRMTQGELDHRINPSGHDDLAELGHSIDTMAERIEAMLDAKRQLLLALSHELRSPLTRARLALELLPPSARRDTIEEDLAEMQSLIAEIIETEQLQQAHSVLNRTPVDLIELVQAEIAAVENVTLHIDGVLATSSAGDTSAAMLADAGRLRILIRNLVANAQLHGRPNGGPAEISVTISANQLKMMLEVADTGPGIQPQDLERITDPLYRPDPSRTRSTGGFGLGLTLARLIAEAHGGTLTVNSEPALKPGTRVRVVLPVLNVDHSAN